MQVLLSTAVLCFFTTFGWWTEPSALRELGVANSQLYKDVVVILSGAFWQVMAGG
jgi:hypothetical protein